MPKSLECSVGDFSGRVTLGGVQHSARPDGSSVIGRYRVWCRGYVANSEELVAKAMMLGKTRVEPKSTAALLALAFQLWDGTFAQHVFGEYAVAVLDTSTNTLVLAHDELGLVPLFYSVARDVLCFATSLSDLVAQTGIGKLNEGYIAHLLTLGAAPRGITPYEHIRRLLPGEHVTWKDQTLTRHQESFPARVEPLLYRDDREYDEHFCEVLTAGIASSMPCAANVWCELSGGMDSSTVLSVIAGRLRRRVAALSSIYPECEQADERVWMRTVLQQYPMPWHTVDGDKMPPFGELPDGFVAEPTAQLVLRSAAERRLGELLRDHGVDVVLTGEGGDSVLLGDNPGPWFFADLLRRGRILRLWRLCRAWSDASGEQRSPTHWLLRFALRGALRPDLAQTQAFNDLNIPWLSQQVASMMEPSPWPPFQCIPKHAPIADTLYLSGIMGSAELVAGGERSRATGVAFRNPLFYKPLVDYMCAVPWERKMSPARDRLVQRRALRDILPIRIAERRDKGSPGQVYFRSLASNREWQERLTARPLIVERGYVDAQRWREAVRDACLARTASLRHFLAAACLEIWLQQLRFLC